MHSARCSLCFIAAVVGATMMPLVAANAQSLPDSTRLAIARVFAPYAASDGPGCAIGISRAGQPVYENGFGSANLETNTPITPSSIFHVASVSKQFTAAAIMLLVRDGKLSLDDDIRKYLPEMPTYGSTITIRHMLQHTSGLRDQWSLLALARGRFEENRITDADVLEIVARQKSLNFAPGTEWEYSNSGFTLASAIVKRVSGKSMRAFTDERIFAPLGMRSTHFHDDYTMLVRGRTSAYAPAPDGWHVSIPNFDTYGATSLFTTTGDLLKWAANLERPTVGDSAMVRQMRTSGVLLTGERTGYGLGLQVGTYRGLEIYGHGGADAGYRTNLDIVPARNLAVVVLCNAANANPTALSRSVIDILTGGPATPSPRVAAMRALNATDMERYAGLWMSDKIGATLELVRRADTLAVTGPVRASLEVLDDSTLTNAARTSEIRWAGADRIRVRPVGATLPPVEYRRVSRIVPTAPMLAEYLGSYASAELGATYEIARTDSTKLVMRTRWSRDFVLEPLSRDRFWNDGDLIAFERDGKGRLTGFTVTDRRSRGVRFTKVAVGGKN